MSQIGKVKSFSLASSSSSSKKVITKKEMEKQKKIAEEEAAAEEYQMFVATFEQDPKSKGKLFVKGSVINAASGEQLSDRDSGQVYRPKKLAELEKIAEREHRSEYDRKSWSSSSSSSHYDRRSSSMSDSHSSKPQLKKTSKIEQKKKSNLELFKEELKMIQEEREERHRIKAQLKASGGKLPSSSSKSSSSESLDVGIRLADEYRLPGMGSYDTGDPNTTNLYLGNINPKMSEQQLCQIFGKYGPLASVKIMWPRSEEERARNRNCGFVAYMNRKDGDRALKSLCGKMIMDYEMKLGWGKAVPIPPHPVYIPPALMELTMPPPPSGLPFNAQPNEQEPFKQEQLANKENLDSVLQNSVVKVVIPTDRTLLCLIHRTIEFVVTEGPMFEAMIMNREINNPTFRFLFDNQSPAHVYYRWRLFSVLQGEHPSKWSTDEFHMFAGGSLWKPPPLNPFLQGMPDELVEASPPASPERAERAERSREKLRESSKRKSDSRKSDAKSETQKGMLSDSQRDKLEDMLRNLLPERNNIGDVMIYCIDHADAAEEIVDCIAESLSIEETPLYKKIARLYLISDILHNCSVKVRNASFFRKGCQSKLEQIFHHMHDSFNSIEGRLKAEQFKQRVMSCFRAWEDWAIYSSDFLIKLQNIFLGLVQRTVVVEPPKTDDEDVDGMPLGDFDGTPLDVDGQPMESGESVMVKFKPSKWETVDPSTVEAQAMTTSKWEMLEQGNDSQDDLDGEPIDPSSNDDSRGSQFLEQLKLELSSGRDSARREKLREIEVKVLKFQDELESGKRTRKTGMSISEQVEEHRYKLLKKELSEMDESEADKRKDRSISPTSSSSSQRKQRKRSRSRTRSRSRSPKRSHHRSSSSFTHHSHHSPRSSRRSSSPSSRGKK